MARDPFGDELRKHAWKIYFINLESNSKIIFKGIHWRICGCIGILLFKACYSKLYVFHLSNSFYSKWFPSPSYVLYRDFNALRDKRRTSIHIDRSMHEYCKAKHLSLMNFQVFLNCFLCICSIFTNTGQGVANAFHVKY